MKQLKTSFANAAQVLLVSVFFLTSNSCKHVPLSETPQSNSKLSAVAVPVTIKSKVLASNLKFPWEVVWDSSNKLWITERGGIISRIDALTGKKTEILKITEVNSQVEGGLLGMALHPDFKSNPSVFVAYNYQSSSGYKGKVVSYR
jgi:glucose/arabinose dehydrogenase